jgi:hypothetical protein
VKVAHDDGIPEAAREAVWLMMEWLDGAPAPTKFILTTMPRRMSKTENANRFETDGARIL